MLFNMIDSLSNFGSSLNPSLDSPSSSDTYTNSEAIPDLGQFEIASKKRNSRSLLSAATLLLSLSLSLALPAFAALSPEEMERKIQEANLVSDGDKVDVVINAEEAIIKKRKPAESKDPERDCKIEAILLGKTVMSADQDIKKVRVRFNEPKDPSRYSEVLIRAGDILAFASGSLSEKDLLASLDLTHGGTSSAPIAEGPEKEKRAELLGRINELEAQGVNVTAYKKQFELLEESAKKQEKDSVDDLLDRLSSAVDSQLKALAMRGKRPAATVSSTGVVGGSNQANASHRPTTSEAAHPNESLEEKMKRLMFKMAQKVHGDLTPVPGMYESERSLIAAKISAKQRSGYDVSADLTMMRQMNTAVERGDNAAVSRLVNEAFAYYRVSKTEIRDWNAAWKANPMLNH